MRTRLFVADGDKVKAGDQLNEGSIYPHELLEIRGRTDTEVYLVQEVQKVYRSQGVDIKDKHIEIIVRQMMKKVRVDQKGDSDYLPGAFVDRYEMARVNGDLKKAKSEQAQFEEIILGITKASLATDSFLSAASFQETTKVLTDAALEGKTDRLQGLKENVIIGKLIPAATGLKHYRRLEIEPTEPVRRHSPEELGLLDENDLAAELGLTEDGELEGFGFGQQTAAATARPAPSATSWPSCRPTRRTSSPTLDSARWLGRATSSAQNSSSSTCSSVSPSAGRCAPAASVRCGGRPTARRRCPCCRRSRPRADRPRTVDGVQLPVRGAEHGTAVEGQDRQILERQGQDPGQVLVRLLLPAGGPDQLEALGQPLQHRPRVGRDAVGDSVDPVERARAAPRRPGSRRG